MDLIKLPRYVYEPKKPHGGDWKLAKEVPTKEGAREELEWPTANYFPPTVNMFTQLIFSALHGYSAMIRFDGGRIEPHMEAPVLLCYEHFRGLNILVPFGPYNRYVKEMTNALRDKFDDIFEEMRKADDTKLLKPYSEIQFGNNLLEKIHNEGFGGKHYYSLGVITLYTKRTKINLNFGKDGLLYNIVLKAENSEMTIHIEHDFTQKFRVLTKD
jgi:hypothetical protein